MKRCIYYLACLASCLVFFPVLCSAGTDTILNPQAMMVASPFNGDFTISLLKEGRWERVGMLSYDRFLTEKTISLDSYISDSERVDVRIEQHGGGAAHIDSALLGGKPPIQVKSIENGLKKLSRKDSDVIDAFGKTIELVFNGGTENRTLSLAARVESKVISKVPFQFPVENTYKTLDGRSAFYTYRINSETGGMELDGTLKDLAGRKPFFKEFSRTGSGHPSGYTYGWVWNDDKNLYVAMDFTPDNTMDGDKDYAKVYANIDGEIKEFKVSVPEQKWGMPSFTYTGNAGYQHKTYQFRLPFDDFFPGGIEQRKDIQLAFAAYGTATPTCPTQAEITYACPFTLTAPTIDGASSSTEWPVSARQFNIPDTIDTINTFFYCMVDGSNLYILVDAVGDETQSKDHTTCDECLLVFHDGTNEYVGEIYTDTGATIEYNMPTGGSGVVGFGSSPNSSTTHRFYEWRIPLSTIDSANNRWVYFSSPAVFKYSCGPGPGGSMPFDGSTEKDNVWPPCFNQSELSTWGVLQFPADDDGDGVPDDVEDGAPNGGDGNGDLTADKYQRNVTSLPSATGTGYLTLEISPAGAGTTSIRSSAADGEVITGDCQNSNVQALTEASQPIQDNSFNYPYGLLSFKTECDLRGTDSLRTLQGTFAVTVTVYYHGATSIDGFTYRKYGPYPNYLGSTQWYTMPGVIRGTAIVGGVIVPTATFTIIDNATGDDDGTGNVIVDQGGIGDSNINIPTMNEWGMVIFVVLAGLGAVFYLRRQRRPQR